jgi:hypothetical protein
MPARKTATAKPAPAQVAAMPAATAAPATTKAPKNAPVKTTSRAMDPAKAPAAAKAAAPAPAAKAAAPAPAAKAAAPAPAAKAAAPAPAAKAAKPAKVTKPAKLRQKPVRDSFTMPEADFSLVATLKARALAGQRETKKSELLRAGLHALAAMDSPTLLAALKALEPIKTGRPKKGH